MGGNVEKSRVNLVRLKGFCRVFCVVVLAHDPGPTSGVIEFGEFVDVFQDYKNGKITGEMKQGRNLSM